MAEKRTLPTIDIYFAEAWWHAHYGFSSDAESWQDPIQRTELDRERRRLLYERFGEVGLGERDPQPRPMVGGEYGDRFMSAVWGCEIRYVLGQAPSAMVLPDAAERLASPELPDLDASPIVQKAFADARLLEERYGSCTAGVNYGGPLNNAVSVLGDEILGACLAEPEVAQRALYRMAEVVLAVHDRVVCRINRVDPATTREKGWGIGNCPVCMLAPRTYREVVLPVDLWLKNQFRGGFGLHHCGIFNPYIEVYRPLEPAALDIGPGSNLRAARAAYPHAQISTWIEVPSFVGMTQENIDGLVAGILEDAAPAHLISAIRVAYAGAEMPDEAVRNLMTVFDRVRI